MSYQDPNQPQYGGYNPNPQQPQQPSGDPYSAPQYGGQTDPYQQPQQPGYQQPQQPGYQQPPNYNPYGQQQQYSGAPGQTSMGMAQNTAAGLSYILGWVTGLIFFYMEKTNNFVRFHAMQSLLFFGGLTVLRILLSIVEFIPGVGLITGIIWILAGLAGFVGWIVLMINGFQGKYFKLPLVGDYAERYVNTGRFN
jgi:uncharacterized membrane protein